MAATAPKAMGDKATISEPTDPKEIVKSHWRTAQKLRATIQKELEKTQGLGHETDAILAGFDRVEQWLANYRLLCLKIIICDVHEAKERCVEDVLWNTHILVTKTYRKVTSGLHGPSLAVSKRKVEKSYSDYLTTAQSFYRAYLQRICGAYKMKELERIARIVKLDEQESNSSIMPPANPEAQAFIDESFPKTLIFLGDLSRYRTLLRSRNRSFKTALTYYALATELMPQSGYGYHQSGVIYAEAGDHLEIVYHMYRAIACAQPHPLAQANLEREFRDLRSQKPGAPRGSLEAMVAWFVKLHAFYYKGDEFSGRKELEDEVDNRLSMTLKNGSEQHADTVLLKIVLINITAYVAGLDRARAEWTDAKSRSCQFILQLNTRATYIISRQLRDELLDLVQQKPSQSTANEATSPGKDEPLCKFTPAFYRILPLFRVYMTWLSYYSKDLTEYRSFLEPQFGELCKTLAHTLTLLLKLLTNYDGLDKAVAWLFPEDEETNGIECLNGPELYDGCQLRYDALARKPKPRADELPDADLSIENASLIRVFDAVLCGLRLAENSPFPIMLPEGSKAFSYVEGVKPVKEMSESLAREPTAPLEPAPATTLPVTPAPVAGLVHEEPNTFIQPGPPALIDDDEDFSDDREFYQPMIGKSQVPPNGPTAIPAAEVPHVTSASEFPIETQLSKLLNDFLAPPEPPTERAPTNREESSYGMGSRTAAELFGAASSISPGPGSATAKAFPSLPWEYFMNQPSLKNTSTIRSAGSGWNSRPGSSGSPMNFPSADGADDPFAPHGEMRGNRSRLSGAFAASPLGMERDWPDQAGGDPKGATSRPLQAQNIRNMWPKAEDSARASGSHAREPSNASVSAWGPSAVLWQHSPLAPQPGAPTSPFSSSMAFAGDSSLPPVNSPWGVPMAQAQLSSAAAPMSTSYTYPASSGDNRYPVAAGYSDHTSYAQMGPIPGDGSASSWAEVYGRYNPPSHADRGYAARPAPASSQTGQVGGQALMDSWANDVGPRSPNYLMSDGGMQSVRSGSQSSPTSRGRQGQRVNPAPSVGRLNWNVKAKPK